jgi:hypothetical protein
MRHTLPWVLLLSENRCHGPKLRAGTHAWAHSRTHARTHSRVHTIHGLLVSLLRSLAHHHGGTSAGAWVAINTWHGGWVSIARRHEMALSPLGIHHLGSRSHSLGSHEPPGGILHHNGWPHMSLLGYELVTLREGAILQHGRSARVRHHLWVIG